jgi:DNA-binding transcriptional ArsR family regulator
MPASTLQEARMTASAPVLDSSPAYDLVESLLILGGRMAPGRWRAWAEQTRARLDAAAVRRLRVWFGGDTPVGGAALALIPRLSAPRDADALLAGLAALPPGDWLRLAVTAGFTDPETPLTSDDLLGLRGAPKAARAYVERYLRLNGRAQGHLLWILDEPEAARAELIEIMRRHLAGPFAAVEPTIRDERVRAAQRLEDSLAGELATALPWLSKIRELRGFSPVVVAPSAFVPNLSAYYHEIRQPLFDGTSYEPYILAVSNHLLLGVTRRGRPATDSPHGERSSSRSGIERSAVLFGLLADPTRLHMLRLLATRPYYGQELASALNISGATTTHHTNELIRAGVVTIERQAHRTYFVLRTASLAHELRASLDFLLRADQAASFDGPGDEKEPVR